MKIPRGFGLWSEALQKGWIKQNHGLKPGSVVLLKELERLVGICPVTYHPPQRYRDVVSLAQLNGLVKRGYVEKFSTGIYRITKMGKELASMLDMPPVSDYQKRIQEEAEAEAEADEQAAQ